MKLLQYENAALRQTKKYPGLLEVEFEHQIKETKATMLYQGPPIGPEVWYEVMAFFRWVQDTMHSECQVRLFLNTNKAVWDAWAFPQEARTGMSAREIAGDEFDRQRAQYPDNDWIYFGTVHHHCNGGAFQSGVDENNEKNQDGLHITMGRMSESFHDIHARFYLGGAKFEPDMSFFWDIGNVRNLIPGDMHDRVARFQMCKHPNTNDFPEKWKTNMVEIKMAVTTPSYFGGTGSFYGPGGSGSVGSGSNSDLRPGERMVDLPLWRRKAIGAKRLMEYFAFNGIPYRDFSDYIEGIKNDKWHSFVTKVAGECGLDAVDMWQECPMIMPDLYRSELNRAGYEAGSKHKKKGKATTQEIVGGVSVPVKHIPDHLKDDDDMTRAITGGLMD